MIVDFRLTVHYNDPLRQVMSPQLKSTMLRVSAYALNVGEPAGEARAKRASRARARRGLARAHAADSVPCHLSADYDYHTRHQSTDGIVVCIQHTGSQQDRRTVCCCCTAARCCARALPVVLLLAETQHTCLPLGGSSGRNLLAARDGRFTPNCRQLDTTVRKRVRRVVACEAAQAREGPGSPLTVCSAGFACRPQRDLLTAGGSCR